MRKRPTRGIDPGRTTGQTRGGRRLAHPSTLQPESEKETPMEAYCFKCRSKREIAAPQRVTLKNGNPAVTGKCPECSCKMFRMVAREVPQ